MGQNKIKVLYDHQIFSLQSYGGISRYFSELKSALDAYTQIKTQIVTGISDNHYLNANPNLAKCSLTTIPKPTYHKFLERINRFYLQIVIGKLDFDIFHPTYYNPYFLRILKGKPFVLTIYDMIPEIFQDQFPVYRNTRRQKKLLITQASQIITISKNTRNDLLNFYDIPEEKVHVIHMAPPTIQNRAISHYQRLKINPDLPKHFLLFVGKRKGYKNFSTFLYSAAPLLKKNHDLHIISIGGGAFSNEERRLTQSLDITGRVHQITASDMKLQELYRKAIAFIYPSLYEGFGLPILEAFQTGCPVVCSRTGSFPEIAQDAALYFDPHDKHTITQTINKILENSKLRRKLSQKGYQRVQDFSWKTTAIQTASVYKLAMDK
jgi:glycosyltransferase involved in cell wall biosynthesis